ncbi:hypothetical protein [Planococcus shixiaomingii]|uniref:hypothetical protein n=1 Tax=Planococcus shixiaomingii TaxID=3058393 RepID=UPI002632E73C|nr:hypothetical protein [Planococcus sp. N022]WKA55209.1 hypothetical protein QWY21_02165 [Planococcus sp. N022]
MNASKLEKAQVNEEERKLHQETEQQVAFCELCHGLGNTADKGIYLPVVEF